MKPQSQKHFDELVSSLDSLVKVYRGLLGVVRQEREILVSSKLDDLAINNKAKDVMLLKLRKLEEVRIEAAKNLAREEGLPEDKARLLDFAVHFQGDIDQRLRSLHAVLDLLLKRVKDYNQQNEQLVKTALSSITGAITTIRDELGKKTTYEKKGGIVETAARSGQIVSREI